MIVTSCFSEIDFAPDGDLDKSVWASPPRVKFNRDAFRGTEHPEIDTVVSSIWTHSYLYLAFWCRYEMLHIFAPDEELSEGNELWTRDVVEAFITPEESTSCHYYEFEVSPDNRGLALEIWLQDRIPRRETRDSAFDHATQIDSASKMWTAEMRIPLRSMAKTFISEIDWRINLYRADGVGTDASRRLLSWAQLQSANHSFHQPESFGVLRFQNARSHFIQ
jgi:hypothetical protein